MRSVSKIRLGEVIDRLIKSEPGLTVTRLADEIGANRNALDNMISANAITRGLITTIKIANRFGLTLDQIVFGDTKNKEVLSIEDLINQQRDFIEVYLDQPIKIHFGQKEKTNNK